jgi:lipoprotein-releasing system ATP-binding protein
MLIADDIHKTYRRHADSVRVLSGLNLEVGRGEFISIVGASGSGKSTLLHLMGTLDKPDSGAIFFDGKRIDNLPGRERDRLRNQTFGFIFQFYHLLPELTTFENVLVPAMVGTSIWNWWGARRDARKRAGAMLERVGLGHRLKHRPRELSGGEMQRAATSTPIRGAKSSSSSATSTSRTASRSSWSRTTWKSSRPPTAWSAWRRARSWTNRSRAFRSGPRC